MTERPAQALQPFMEAPEEVELHAHGVLKHVWTVEWGGRVYCSLDPGGLGQDATVETSDGSWTIFGRRGLVNGRLELLGPGAIEAVLRLELLRPGGQLELPGGSYAIGCSGVLTKTWTCHGSIGLLLVASFSGQGGAVQIADERTPELVVALGVILHLEERRRRQTSGGGG